MPTTMRLRRAPDSHSPRASNQADNASPVLFPTEKAEGTPNEGASHQDAKTAPGAVEADGDVVMDADNNDAESTAAPAKFGFQVLCNAVNAIVDAIGQPHLEKKVAVDLLLQSDFNLDVAVNNYLNESRVVSDFRGVVGHDWDPAKPSTSLKQELYHATIPSGPLGLTVENILEVSRCSCVGPRKKLTMR